MAGAAFKCKIVYSGTLKMGIFGCWNKNRRPVYSSANSLRRFFVEVIIYNFILPFVIDVK